MTILARTYVRTYVMQPSIDLVQMLSVVKARFEKREKCNYPRMPYLTFRGFSRGNISAKPRKAIASVVPAAPARRIESLAIARKIARWNGSPARDKNEKQGGEYEGTFLKAVQPAISHQYQFTLNLELAMVQLSMAIGLDF